VIALRRGAGAAAIARLEGEGSVVTVDASLYKETSSRGFRFKGRRGYAIFVEKTRSVCLFRPDAGAIHVLNEDEDALARDTVRLVKSLVSLDAERRGHIILHASGAVLGGRQGVLFLGDSRNGKTTILLEVLDRFDAAMLSCDTSVLRLEEGRLVARGWPSNFSASIGTVFDYEGLSPLVPKDKRGLSYREAWDIFDKHVLDTMDVITCLGCSVVPEHPVHVLVCLRFDPSARTAIAPIGDCAAIQEWLTRVYLGSRDPLYPNWHGFWSVDDRGIDESIATFAERIANSGIRVYQMDWAPGPEALLRRVDELDRHSRKTAAMRGVGRCDG
jgi:hypothetical protein